MERRISKAGCVNIPLMIRRELGIEAGEKVQVVKQADGSLMIDRIEGTCILCGATENVRQFNGRFVCNICRKELSE